MKRRQLLLTLSSLPLLHRAQAAASPVRLVSIGGALTELVYALDAQSLLVGVDTTSLYPAAARSLPNVGYARTLSAEGLLSLRPTLIIATEDAGPTAVLRQVEAAHVPLHTLRAEHRFEGLLERTRQLGELLDRRPAATALADQFSARWRTTQQQVAKASAGHAAPRVLFILSHAAGQVRIAGQNTAADAVIRYAGAVNALQDVDGYKPLTPEAVIATAPDAILTTDMSLDAGGGIDGILKLPGIAQTPAGRARRVVSQDALELLGFGPRLPQSVARLAQALHPA
ncbi:ABC transporter substrate-binding protein [Paucibacter sp. R3-3]|uniref:ABC transporter substrate-binding protein n=1 Tax=Roseateles agri TaxID=3098619 RepID=A0ABU5DEG5_9BURK|nr:ABC transporter substrate-binding protein [Paucibacter sp. R3-3]MDY0744196.1 ABC transporter substrate-binding protein [Paucibacter sp. R3-3]